MLAIHIHCQTWYRKHKAVHHIQHNDIHLDIFVRFIFLSCTHPPTLVIMLIVFASARRLSTYK